MKREENNLSTSLDVSGLYAIGGLLLVILGFSGILLRKKDTAWNIQLATLIISWILISKGLQALIRLLYDQGSFDITTTTLGSSNYLTEVFTSMNIMTNFFFVFLSALLALIFPVNFLNQNRTTRVFSVIIFVSILISAMIFSFWPDFHLIEGLVNDPPAATIWGIIYLYSVFNEDQENKTWKNIADICALLMIAILGSYFFHWLGKTVFFSFN